MADAPDKVVTITMQNGLPVSSPDPVPVKKSEQKIKWCADFDFRISIDGYTDVTYSSSSTGNGCAFQARSGKFEQERYYKYTITANGVENDPGIEVKP